jgi:hypothetical protein
MGRKLSRAEALAHPWKAAAFEVSDNAFAKDASLRGFMTRAQCGHAATPLEQRYGLPDVMFQLGQRGEHTLPIAVLGGERFFVRARLELPVEGYGAWTVGVWVEVRREDHARICAAWDDPEAYMKLHFAGTLANDVGKQLDLPVPAGVPVEVRPTELNEPPRICVVGELAPLLSQRWSQQSFERYAVKRGFL